MEEKIKFRAVIRYNSRQKEEAERFGDKNTEYTIKHFTLKDLINPIFSIRELVIPWLEAGNQPDLYIRHRDKNKKEIYVGDILHYKRKKEFEFIGVVKWDEEALSYYTEDNDGDTSWLGSEDVKFSEIIGNIHIKPEKRIK